MEGLGGLVEAHRPGVVLAAGEVLVDVEAGASATEAGAGDGALGVDQASALLQRAVGQAAAERRGTRRIHQLALDLVGSQGGVVLEHQGDDA